MSSPTPLYSFLLEPARARAALRAARSLARRWRAFDEDARRFCRGTATAARFEDSATAYVHASLTLSRRLGPPPPRPREGDRWLAEFVHALAGARRSALDLIRLAQADDRDPDHWWGLLAVLELTQSLVRGLGHDITTHRAAAPAAPPTLWFHGGSSYSLDGGGPALVSQEMHNVLRLFLDRDEALDTRALSRCTSNVAEVVGKLQKKFGAAAVRRPGRDKGAGYYIRVRSRAAAP
jgi:hypothetical protein